MSAWWRRTPGQTSLPKGPTEYPTGTFVKTDKGYFYIFSNTVRYRIISRRCLHSWSPHRVVRTTEQALAKYRVAAKMKFRNGSLIHNFSDGRIYLISEGKRRHVQSLDALDRIGAVLKEAITVSPEEINLHEQGEPLK